MAVEGSLDLFSLPEILQMISQQGKTGILTIQGQQDIVAISFLAGRIVAADSLAHTVEEGLAKLLVNEGLLSAADLARAGVEHQAGGGRLLDLLVERRYLTRLQLLGALRLQTVRQLEALLRWQEGDFKFYGGDEVSYEEGFEPISVEDLLLRNLPDFRDPPPPAAREATAAAKEAAASKAGGAAAARATAAPAGARAAAPVRATAAPAAPGTAAPAGPGAAATRGTAGPVGVVAPARPATAGMAPGSVSAAAGAGGRAAPAPGAATRVRGSAVPSKPESGELWLPQVPELPDLAPPPGSGRQVPERAAGPVTAAGSDATEVPGAGLTAAGLPAAVLPDRPAAVAGLPGAAAPAMAGAAAAAEAALPAAQPGPELLPWPAAVLAAPPAAAPARPRPSGAGMAKPPGLPAAASSAFAAAAMGLAGSSSTAAIVPPDTAAAVVRQPRVAPQLQGGLAAYPARSGPARQDPAAPAARRRPAAAGGRILPEDAPGRILPKSFRQMAIERADRLVPLAHRLLAAGLAAAAAAGLVVATRSSPETVLLPFPWEQGERAAYVRNQRESLYDKIETAAKTAFLRDFRFPDQLSQLRDAGLLAPVDLVDPRGEPLLYSAREDSYTLQATEGGKPLIDADTSASIAGNFFLDPSVLQSASQNGPPIVLLD